MPLTEFSIIERYFTRCGRRRDDVVTGVGDDGAVLRVPPDRELVVSIDTLVGGVHFPAATDPESIGHKALAVNLSDLAAMGAEPAWATLALTLPRPDEVWLEGFSRGLSRLAERYNVQLVGGDTTRGPLSITLQAHGFVPPDAALRRAGARPGDLVYVTGTLGDAGLALRVLREGITLPEGHKEYLMHRLNCPEPRVAEGIALRGLAHAVIDISDGLAADLGHILAASGVGATLEVAKLPLSPAMRAFATGAGAWNLALSAGDDYELCFTAPADKQAAVERGFASFACGCTCIGVIEAEAGLRCVRPDGTAFTLASSGYEHFGAGTQ